MKGSSGMYFDSFQSEHKRPFGAVEAGEEIFLSVKAERREGVYESEALLFNDAGNERSYPMEWIDLQGGYDVYAATLKAPEAGLWFYAFRFHTARGEKYLGPGRGEVHAWNDRIARQLTVCEKGFETPNFLKGGVIYHIFVDRFCRGAGFENTKKPGIIFHDDWEDTPVFEPDSDGIIQNIDFFGGNLAGIREKLPYLSGLGVTVLYLSPIFEARSNHKYDTGDYGKIDSMFGTETEFRLLCDEAANRGMRVILDGVFNHTGDDSRYFNRYGSYPGVGAYQSAESPYYGWYSFDSYPDSYASWWGVKTLPAVRDDDPGFREYMTGENGVVRRWLRLGASGWRLDVADELSDNFIEDIRAAAKAEKPDALLIGEVWEDASNKISYGRRRKYLTGGQLDSVMNYPLKDAIIAFVRDKNAEALASVMDTLYENYPKEALDTAMNILGTHDTARILTVLGEEDVAAYSREEKASLRLSGEKKKLAIRRLKIAVTLQMTLPGVPAVYYGDEAGLEGFEDPFNRRPYPWGKENAEILAHYRKIISIRRNCPSLRRGGYERLWAGDGVFLFRRDGEEEFLIVGANVSGKSFSFLVCGELHDLRREEPVSGELTIPPGEYIILSGPRRLPA